VIRRIVAFALYQPLFILLGLILFIGAGLWAFNNLPVEAFPDVTDTQATVIALYPGRAAEEVEKQVTIPLEVGLSGLPGAVRMFSLAAVLWGATTVVVKASRLRLSPHKTLFYQLAGSAPMLLALAWLTGEAGLTRPTALVLGALAYQIVVVAFASYLAWFWLLTRFPAAPLAAFSFWTPIFGMLASWLLLGEPVRNPVNLHCLINPRCAVARLSPPEA